MLIKLYDPIHSVAPLARRCVGKISLACDEVRLFSNICFSYTWTYVEIAWSVKEDAVEEDVQEQHTHARRKAWLVLSAHVERRHDRFENQRDCYDEEPAANHDVSWQPIHDKEGDGQCQDRDEDDTSLEVQGLRSFVA